MKWRKVQDDRKVLENAHLQQAITHQFYVFCGIVLLNERNKIVLLRPVNHCIISSIVSWFFFSFHFFSYYYSPLLFIIPLCAVGSVFRHFQFQYFYWLNRSWAKTCVCVCVGKNDSLCLIDDCVNVER